MTLRSFYALTTSRVKSRRWTSFPSRQRFDDGVGNREGIGPDLGFPEAQDSPAHFLEPQGVLSIALDVSLDLGEPVARVCPATQLLPTDFPVPPVPEIA